MYVKVAVRRLQVVFVDEDWCYWMGGAHGMDNVQGLEEDEPINKGLNFLVVNLNRWWTCRMQVRWAIDRERGGAWGSVLPMHLFSTGWWRFVVTTGALDFGGDVEGDWQGKGVDHILIDEGL